MTREDRIREDRRTEAAVAAAARERDQARALLLDCWKAISSACATEDGLDASDGLPLLERIEAVCPEAKALMEHVNSQPVI